MKNKMREIFFGKGNAFNGLIALIIVGLFVLGCNCSKQIGDLGKKDNPPANTFTPTNTGTVPQKQKASVPTNSTGQMPSAEETEAIVQEAIQDFATGVEAGDFSTFYNKSSKGFKRTYTNESIKTNFIAFVNQKARVVPILRSTATMTPYYGPAAAIVKDKGFNVLRANGSYSTSPTTAFELDYLLEDKRWKVIGIRIKMQ